MSESVEEEEELGSRHTLQEQDLGIEELWQAVTSLQLLALRLLDRIERLAAASACG